MEGLGTGEGRQVMLGPRHGESTDARFTHPTQARTHQSRSTRHTRFEHTGAEGILTHGIPVVGPRDGSAGNVAGVKSASQEPVPRGDEAISLRGIRSSAVFASIYTTNGIFRQRPTAASLPSHSSAPPRTT
ncbi:hypothetical protein KM043_018001 [Ampulex compressa]|nr:hypothetical protein KM043_018001 [Ampulex compressa]